MKKVNLLLCSLLIAAMSIHSYAQKATRTSVANGNFYMPQTWDCACVPAATDNIIINTKVVLDYDRMQSGGNVTINANGSLKKNAVAIRQFLFSGNGVFTNNGVFAVDRVAFTAGSLINNDSMVISHAFSNAGNLTNSGVITLVDSLYSNGTMTNNSTGSITSIGFVNEGTYTNKGHHYSTAFYNTSSFMQKNYLQVSYITSTSQMQNDSVIDVLADFYNMGRLVNSTNGRININVDFLNNDSANHYASVTNNGYFGVGGNWLNIDTVKGNGRFCIGQSTQNNGQMLGNFDFCDQTNLLGNHIDYNTGYIAPTITYCTYACGVGIAETTPIEADFMVYPNPAKDVINIRLGSVANTAESLVFTDVLGKTIFEINTNKSETINIKVDELKTGVYFYFVKSADTVVKSGKLMVQ